MLLGSYVHAVVKSSSHSFDSCVIAGTESHCDFATACSSGLSAILGPEKRMATVVLKHGQVYLCWVFFFFFLLTNSKKVVIASGHVLVVADGSRSRFSVTVPLLKGDDLVGEARVSISVALAWNGSLHGPAFAWPADECIIVGHRGYGCTADRLGVLENTLLAFQTAFRQGLRWAEFDVQLTYDKVPVLFHDDRVPIRTGGASLLVPVSEFDSAQMELLSRPGHVARTRSCSSLSAAAEISSTPAASITISESFPSFERVLCEVPPDMGFNVELKFSELRIGSEGTIVNRGLLVDRVLDVLSKVGGARKIVFSSFDPDLCLICKLKQKRYPVFFLTEGAHVVDDDPRQNSLEAAIVWAKRCGLDGIVADVASFVQRPEMVKAVHAAKLAFVSYGKLNNDPKVVALQRQWKMNGIITDTWRVLKEK